jgi:hypothetical protein
MIPLMVNAVGISGIPAAGHVDAARLKAGFLE